MGVMRWLLVFYVITTLGYGVVIPQAPACKNLTGDEKIGIIKPIPYLGSLALGDTIGTTWYDLQASCAPGQRIFVDDYGRAHVNWTKMDSAQQIRFCGWNARLGPGSYVGETQASPSWSGFVQLDITDDNRTVVAYHYNDGSSYYSWIDIDDGPCWGSFGNNMGNNNCGAEQHIWPAIAVKNNNITMVTGDNVPPGDNKHHMYFSTNLGQTFAYVAEYDSCTSFSQVVRASRASNKVVHAWTQSIAMDYPGQLISQSSCDVKYELSTDGGITWSTPVNITNYQPPGTMVNGDTADNAYCDVCAVFDENDFLHLVWTINRVWVVANTIYYRDRSKIMHWDEISDSITTVNSPSIYYNEPNGYWIDTNPMNPTGAAGPWRLACDRPQLIVDNSNGDLFCLWLGNDDTTDVSGAHNRAFNNEIFYSYSQDGGITWSDYQNLTNTRTPGAPAGACMDENYMTASPAVVNDNIYITYIEDKDAGQPMNGYGTWTENPVRLYVFNKYGITENEYSTIEPRDFGATILSGPLLLPANKTCKVFNITGRRVHTLNPAPGIYFIEVDGKISHKVIKIR